MVAITLYARQKKRHRCIEQTFGLYGRRRGWDNLREQHRNMYIIKCEKQILKHENNLRDLWDNIKHANIHLIAILGENKERSIKCI